MHLFHAQTHSIKCGKENIGGDGIRRRKVITLQQCYIRLSERHKHAQKESEFNGRARTLHGHFTTCLERCREDAALILCDEDTSCHFPCRPCIINRSVVPR